MKNQIKKCAITLIMVFVYLLFCSPVSYAYVAANWRECAVAPGCDCTLQATNNTMKNFIVDSTGFFLNSHSAFQAFLNRVEMSETNGTDSTELKEILLVSIENMEKAKAAYTNFKAASDKIPYHQTLIDQLKKFDYDTFQDKYGLIKPIFVRIKRLLSKGNIAGFDLAVLANMDIILGKLYKIQASINKDAMPEIALLWRTNQAYMEAQLFAQYMSEVFKAILF